MSNDKHSGNSSRRATPSPPVQAVAADYSAGTQLAGVSSKQRRGTDPAKFKTTICRNWESTGSCTFRGCTFAHGSDELRQTNAKSPSPSTAPAAPPVTPPALPAQVTPPSGASHPPPLPRSLAANSQSKTSSLLGEALHIRSRGAGGSDGAATPNSGPSTVASFTVSTPTVPAAHHSTSPMQSSALPPPPPPSYAAAIAGHFGHGTAARPPQAQGPFGAGSSPSPSLASPEHIADAILGEVAHCRDLLAIHADANASLERAVAAERNQRRELSERLRELKGQAAALKQDLDKKRAATISAGKQPPVLRPAAAQPPLNAAATAFVPSFAPATMASLGGSMASPDVTATANGTMPVLLKLASSATSASASTSDVASDAAASPTDPGTQDRLRKILENLHLDDE